MEDNKELSRRGPVVIDADAFDPVPRNVFRYGGEDYPAFDILQISNSARERVKRIDQHLARLSGIDKRTELLASVITDFVPDAPLDKLREEPIEKLTQCIVGLARALGGGSDPMKGRRKSGSRRSMQR